MALGKTVLAEALDLAKDGFGEVEFVAAFEHALDELVVEAVDDAGPPPGAHGAAQHVGLARRETGGDDRELHDLLLEDGHAESPVEHGLAQGFGCG